MPWGLTRVLTTAGRVILSLCVVTIAVACLPPTKVDESRVSLGARAAASVRDGTQRRWAGPTGLFAHLLNALFQHVHGNIRFFFGHHQRRSPTPHFQCTGKCRTLIQEQKKPQAAYATKRSARLDARVSPKEKKLIEAT